VTLILTSLFELFFLPPGLFIFLLLLSVFLVKDIYRLKRLIFLQILLLYLLSIPVTSHYLFAALETTPALTPEQIQNTKPDAIIVLAGGIKSWQKEYHGADVGYFTQLRLRYAAWLQKQTGLPVLVTGGIEKDGITEAELMKKVLVQEYQVTAKVLVEKNSQNTYENALYSKKIMAQHQLKQAYLVTNAFHMPRALMVFEKQQLDTIPAPMAFFHNNMDYLSGDFLPQSKVLWQNYLALHEIIGFYWYQIRY
jgi:uncharacterized SAM-binding protein YcdF (DUF218 family)